MKLSTAALPLLTNLSVPTYSRADLRAGIVHFGVGNFHRAHQAVYLDELFRAGRGRDWAIVGAGVREADIAMHDKLKAQDFLTTVVAQEADSSSATITASMVDFLPVGNAIAIINRLADPAIRIVSLTVTEGGYYIDPASQKFDAHNRDIVADAANFSSPKTVFGLILAGLKRRRDIGVVPFTIMSCDNIPHNGDVTRNAVVGLARQIYPELAMWVAANVAFPNGMVDRITPATTGRHRQIVFEEYGIEDNWPVFCEDFRQWVLEDNFPAGRPPLEEVGVTFVPDVSPYELMKIRILNGGHAAVGYPAALMDIQFVHEAMETELIRDYLRKLERDEIISVVPPVPNTNLDAYFGVIERRFANPRIGDTIQRLCLDGSNRQPKFILPSARDRLAAGASVTGLALVSALWCRYCAGTSDSGKSIAPNDASWDRLQARSKAAKDDPAEFLQMGDIFGDLAQNEAYGAAFGNGLRTAWEVGAEETLRRYLDGQL